MTRYDFDALQEVTRLGVSDIARLVKIDRTSLQRWKRDGLTLDQAELVAVRCGFVPENLWPAWREESNARAAVLEERDRVREEARQERRRRIQRESKRRRYWENEKNRQKKIEASRRYYAECTAFVLAKKNRYRAANWERLNERRRELYRQQKAS